MRVIEEDVYMTLGLPKRPLKVIESKDETNASIKGEDFRQNCITFIVSRMWATTKKELYYLDRKVNAYQFLKLRGWTNEEIKSRAEHEFKIEFRKSYEDSLDKTTGIDEEKEVNEEEHCNKSVEAKAKVEDQIGVSKVKVEVMIELEELLPGACTLLKRIRKIAMESTSDALIRGIP
ncbi:hypothetical protein Cgig2_013560 [Carnegiea gigantea]|uniref:Uncharacterized protein n=1 Tax=Carnegiea gigantea TaxID=171969 RepID=A0A9Q1JJ59_9CARY|nr:hypothetical protein Cgig2_013560 [Carnegiea gigantea]